MKIPTEFSRVFLDQIRYFFDEIIFFIADQTMLVKASRVQLPQIEKASHVQIESIFGATTNLVGNGFNFHQHHHNNVNGDAAHAHEIHLR